MNPDYGLHDPSNSS